MIVIGVDPGLTTGIAMIDTEDRGSVELIQCTAGVVVSVVDMLTERVADCGGRVNALAVERFVSGPRSGKLATPKGAAVARTVIERLTHWSLGNMQAFLHPAAAVKPWATDARLKAAGIEHRGMPHALDAARHALFVSVNNLHQPDPLSRRAGARGARSMLFEPAVGAPQHPDGGT